MFYKTKTLAAVLATLCAVAAVPAQAAPAGKATCEPTAIKVSSSSKDVSQYSVTCKVGSFLGVTPQVEFTGTIPAGVKAPYPVKAHYTVDVRDNHTRKLGKLHRQDQAVSSTLTSATDSIAGLGAQFAHQMAWDPSGVLSVEEAKGKWRVFSLQGAKTTDRADGTAGLVELGVLDAGLADTAFENGRAIAKIVLDDKLSRFAAKAVEDVPDIQAALGLKEGKLVMLEGATRVVNHEDVQNALLRLDRAPADMSRAWALAARAQLLGLSDEVRYAEQKVATHNPQLLSEFQEHVQRLAPFTIPAELRK